jgi:glycosyltransferase involved in cell wall biosynthesis
MVKISAVILTLNEERNIGRCLESLVDIVDEIVVIDSFSTDKTEEIVKRHNARFIQQKFLGYIEQKNFGMEQVSHEYVLSLDADEALSPELRESIIAVKDNFQLDGYSMNRLANYCGKWIRHSGWYPDRKLRLVNRTKGKWAGTNPHDKFALEPGSKTSILKGDLFHYTFYTVEEHKKQVDNFSSIAAQAKFDKGDRSSWLKLMVKPIAKFLKSYVLKRGFLDGYYGWLIGVYSAKATYLKYMKLLKIQRG